MENKRQHKKRKKLRKGRVFLTFLFILLIGVAGYVFFQYKSGVNLAEADMPDAATMKFDGDEQSNAGVENILLVGVDSRGEEKSRSDTMMLVSWNRNTNDVKIVSFMRDIFATIPGVQDRYKLNTAYYLGGADLLKGTLKQMFNLEINHVAVVDFKNFEKVVDIAAPNGVEVEVPHDMSKNIGVSLKKGVQQLNGKELLGFARFRYDAEGDFGRVERQQQVIEALKNEMLRPSSIASYPKLIGAIQGYVQSDITKNDQIKMILGAVKGGDVNIEKLTIPVKDGYVFARDAKSGSVIEIDLDKNLQALNNFLVFD